MEELRQKSVRLHNVQKAKRTSDGQSAKGLVFIFIILLVVGVAIKIIKETFTPKTKYWESSIVKARAAKNGSKKNV